MLEVLAEEQSRRSEEDSMSTIRTQHTNTRLPDPDFVHPEVVAPETRGNRVARYVLALTRLSLGWIFLWAFLDKTFGLGHETAGADAWIRGGSPTQGFLAFGAAGPFKGVYNDIAGAAWADWLFMLGLIGIGTALVLGITMRLAAAAGVLLLVLMWTAVLPPANNPFMDDHLVYAMVLVALAAAGTGSTLGLGKFWQRIPVVRRNGWLK
jgi:thiosulfate dehydrogenase (quinone) large subunit